jgi:hypothetical protein
MNATAPIEFSNLETSIWIGVKGALAACGLIVNAIIMYAFVRNRVLRSKDGLYFMTLLALCDTINCLSYITGPVYSWYEQTHPKTLTV